MSLSSGATLTSPTANKSFTSVNHTPMQQRRSSTHVMHTNNHPKRRPSQHSAHHAGPSRRGSEGETGRRAAAAGLAMHGMDGKAPRRKSGDVSDGSLVAVRIQVSHL